MKCVLCRKNDAVAVLNWHGYPNPVCSFCADKIARWDLACQLMLNRFVGGK